MTFAQASTRRACPAGSAGPWQWAQRWSDLLFLHWHVAHEALRPLVPAALELDTWDGMPWVSLVGFRLDVRHCWLPSFGLTNNIIELNLRTYVLHDGMPGIYFLSIHADSRLAVALARILTPLPYVHAHMSYEPQGKKYFGCDRPQTGAGLHVVFDSYGKAETAGTGSRAEWLLERYALFAAGRRGNILRTIAEHPPWHYEEMDCACTTNTMGDGLGLDLRGDPDCSHFSAGVEARLGPFR